jgi:putative membrane protein
MPGRLSRTLLSLVAVACLVSGCRFFRPYDPNAPKTKPVEKPAEPVTQPVTQPVQQPEPARPAQQSRNIGSVSDANIAAMVLASNNTDISYARLVPTRADRQDVKQFAARMLTDHTGVNALVNELLAKLDLTPADNTASLDMRDESADKRDMMRELTGYAFDSTYIENEVAYHRKFLRSIDEVMLPRTRNGDLKTLLTSMRPAVAAHLAHAEQVRANVLSKK